MCHSLTADSKTRQTEATTVTQPQELVTATNDWSPSHTRTARGWIVHQSAFTLIFSILIEPAVSHPLAIGSNGARGFWHCVNGRGERGGKEVGSTHVVGWGINISKCIDCYRVRTRDWAPRGQISISADRPQLFFNECTMAPKRSVNLIHSIHVFKEHIFTCTVYHVQQRAG